MARVFGEEFAPYLGQLCLLSLLASCKQAEQGEDSLESESLSTFYIRCLFIIANFFHAVSVADAASAFASGSSPANAIAVGEEIGVNENLPSTLRTSTSRR